MKNRSLLVAALSLTVAAVACSSTGTTSGTGSTGDTSTSSSGAGGSGGGGGPMAPATSCKQAGDKGNENGVGTYCTPHGDQCVNFPKAGLCLADLGEKQWWCSRIGCKTDMDCGTAAHCHVDPGGTGCVPDACEAPTTATSSGSSSASSSASGTSSSSSTGTGG